MFCFQCEQTAGGKGCTVRGVCGKKPEIADLQDMLIFGLRKLSLYASEAWKLGLVGEEEKLFTIQALFATLTNVNFDEVRLKALIDTCFQMGEGLKQKVLNAGGNINFDDPATEFEPAGSLEELIKQANKIGFPVNMQADEDIRSLQAITLFGIKGVSAYADHAWILGKRDDRIYRYIHETLASFGRKDLALNDWIGMTLKCGEINLIALELLDAGNTETYGHPVPTAVPLNAKAGKAILISGHDLADLEALLQQTEGKGIYIYTHGEMLPTHGYPELKKYPHFYGHYGTAWQNQKKEFKEFPGAILMTTNCIQEPQPEYIGNIFTSGPVAWPGVQHVSRDDLGLVIECALSMPGFEKDEEHGSVMVGFGRNAVLGVAGQVIDAVKAGAIKHFFLVGGCDGAKSSRSYYSTFAEKAPQDTVILTLACGKYRFFDKDLGTIEGIPRLIDVGQCNDAYSAVQIAVALAGAFGCTVNELPLSLIISWYEQKAVAILLTLLHLGIKNIRLGPSLPAFITPNVLNVLVNNFNIMPISSVEEDLAAILG
ncbi:MAG: hydroxylamine reductase [Bacillota bacterium]